jgi:alanine racemase
LKQLRLEGIYTHFPVADSDPEFTNYQISAFNDLITRLEAKGISFRFHHCANSIGILNYPNAHFNMVRPGLILYGIKPAAEADVAVEPVLSLKSKVIFVKKIAKGAGVSYGRTYIARSARNIATVAVGYADGYPWALSNKAKVIINNKLYPLVGRVCMDHIMVDVRNAAGILPGKEVVLIGKAGDFRIGVEDLAQWADTIPYEIVSRLSLKIPRIYKD